jgi:hypothetical protein
VDESLFKQLRNEQELWRNVLKRVVLVKFLSERGLPFQCQNEDIGSVNNGNYLRAIELLAQYDAFLGNRLNRFRNAGCGVHLYLSSTICNEFINFWQNKFYLLSYLKLRLQNTTV